MRIFITGATGFIGNHLVKELKKTDAKLLVLSRQKKNFDGVEWCQADISNINKIESYISDFKPEVIYHLAWEGIPDYSKKNSKKNLYNSVNLLDAVLKIKECRKIIVAGSCWEYDKSQGQCYEHEKVEPKSEFARAKYSLFKYLDQETKKYKKSLNWFRIFFAYGLGQKKTSLIPSIISSIRKGDEVLINNPNNKNDFIFIADVIKVLLAATFQDVESGIYNLGSGKSYSVKEISNIIYEKLKIVSPYTVSNNKFFKNENVDFWADMTKTNFNFNINNYTAINDGIEMYINEIISDNKTR